MWNPTSCRRPSDTLTRHDAADANWATRDSGRDSRWVDMFILDHTGLLSPAAAAEGAVEPIGVRRLEEFTALEARFEDLESTEELLREDLGMDVRALVM